MMTTLRHLLTIGLLAVASTTATAADKAPANDNVAPKGFTALFNGKDLTGWHAVIPPTVPAKKTLDEQLKAVKEADADIFPHWTIVDGAIMLGDRVQKLMSTQGIRPPVGLLTVLQHIVLSHHGVPEFGAAKLPATPEAILISCLDNLDAKAAMSLHAARPDRGENAPKNFGGNFTEKNFALGTKLFKLNPLDPA